MAQNEMRAMRGMPQCVRLSEGLGRTPEDGERCTFMLREFHHGPTGPDEEKFGLERATVAVIVTKLACLDHQFCEQGRTDSPAAKLRQHKPCASPR